jgi:hypothetical protein
MRYGVQKFGSWLVVGAALCGLTFSMGCGFDCDDAISNYEKLRDRPFKPEKRNKIISECERELDDDAIKCVAKATGMKAFNKCWDQGQARKRKG